MCEKCKNSTSGYCDEHRIEEKDINSQDSSHSKKEANYVKDLEKDNWDRAEYYEIAQNLTHSLKGLKCKHDGNAPECCIGTYNTQADRIVTSFIEQEKKLEREKNIKVIEGELPENLKIKDRYTFKSKEDIANFVKVVKKETLQDLISKIKE